MLRKDHPLYATWKLMRQRCRSPDNPKYKDYGARGITVDPSWNSFDQFVEDMGPRPIGCTLDRRDNNGPYSKDNCRWATAEEQGQNKRNNVRYTFRDETLTRDAWAERLGIPVRTLRWRIEEKGWPLEMALTTPKRKYERCQAAQ